MCFSPILCIGNTLKRLWACPDWLVWLGGGGGLNYKGSFEVVGRSDEPLDVLFLFKEQMTSCSLIRCQLSASPDHLCIEFPAILVSIDSLGTILLGFEVKKKIRNQFINWSEKKS